MPEKQKELKIIIQEGREMTDAEVESVVSILFQWWRSEFEQSLRSTNQEGLDNGDIYDLQRKNT